MTKLLSSLSLALILSALTAALCLAADGKELYAKCAGCHGADGTKQGMGLARPLKGLTADEAAKALAGYKAKTFGGNKKTVMEGMTAGLSDADIKALAAHIAAF